MTCTKQYINKNDIIYFMTRNKERNKENKK